MTLISADKEKVKRVIPKGSNKVIDAAVARLYIAYPNPSEWTYTGLSGAVVLVDDLVGHTFFLKLVDIHGHRGVVWDQELFIDFQYNQDRSFFHTFEIEDCLVGLLFDDTNEASHFLKKVQTREKHGSKKTVQNKNAIALKKKPEAPRAPGPRGEFSSTGEQRIRRTTHVQYYDDLPPPEWRSLYSELESAGITEDMIADNKEFIKDYINKQGGPLVGLEPPIPRKYQHKQRNVSTPSTGISHSNSTIKKKAPPPPPSAAMSHSPSPGPGTPDSRSRSASVASSIPQPPDLSQSSTPEPQSAASNRPVHSIPPPLQTNTVHNVPPPPPAAAAGQPTYSQGPPLPQGGRPTPPLPGANRPTPALPTGNRPGPPLPTANRGPPPPAPPRAGMAAPSPPAPPQRFGQPTQQPSQQLSTPPGQQGRAPPPAPPPRRGNAPPAPPSRSTGAPPPAPPPRRQPAPMIPQRTAAQPPQQQQQQPQYSPQVPQAPAYPQQQSAPIAATPPAPPPFPTQQQAPAAPAPPPLPPTGGSAAPAPPPLPPTGGSGAPPPPFPSGSGAPPTAPALPQGNEPPAPALPQVDGGRDALLASIRGAGVGSLRKTDKSQLDKPSVMLQEQRGEAPAPSSSAPGGVPGGGGSLADALAAALSNRKQKVSKSDDESDGEEW